MLILGIETSCDETAIAVMEVRSAKRKAQTREVLVKSNVVSSQVQLHAQYGGVVPHLAAREHEKNLPLVLAQALREARLEMTEIDLIAVTAGPGLSPALWRGVNFANALADEYHKPLVATNHMAGHVYSNWLAPVGQNSAFQVTRFKLFPALCLVVSGGHSELLLMTGYEKFKLVGKTVDDAAGEAFDKIARILQLGYPGGPAIAAAAAKRKTENVKHKTIKLPRPMLHSPNYNFSFSGLKTAVLYLVRGLKKLTPAIANTIAYEAQEAITDVLVTKTVRAAQEYKVKSLMLSGGVSANRRLRACLAAAGKKLKLPVLVPPLPYTTDNAAMIALAGYWQAQSVKRKAKSLKQKPVQADANWELC